MLVDDPDYTEADFQRVCKIAKDVAGISMPESKKTLVYSRVSRRVRENGYNNFRNYLNFVESPDGQAELEKLICVLTTNVTSFFREREHFTHLEKVVIPSVRERARAGERIRFWSAACSTGPEPWSMAMSVMTVFPEAAMHDVRILATDINSEVVAQAASGTYREEEIEGIPNEMRMQFMEPVGQDSLRFTGSICKLPAFRVLNLNLEGWPIKVLFSAIFCRNVVIYFDEPTREHLWRRLSARLEPGGFLYVGHSERVVSLRECGLEQIAPTTYKKVG
ncbi:MAG: chemotaxis protein [Acetobacter sp.]|nr:chemotaxis protein [Acetobacter sp.]